MLSGFVAGLVYTQRQLRDGHAVMRDAFFKRALKLYVCQAALLVFLLGVVGLVGVAMHQPAITDLVSFFLDNPLTALFSGLLLLYNPPLLDILPMYVLFMILSPLLLLHASRHGWERDRDRQRAGLAGRAVRPQPSRLRRARPLHGDAGTVSRDRRVRDAGLAVHVGGRALGRLVARRGTAGTTGSVSDLGRCASRCSTRWFTLSGGMRSGRRRFRTTRSSACSTTSGSSARSE
jgi:hypothetical protein